MKQCVILFVLVFNCSAVFAQYEINQLQEVVDSTRLQKWTKKKLKKFFHKTHSISFLKDKSFVALPSFTILNAEINSETRNPINLVPNKDSCCRYVIILQDNRYEGLVDLKNGIFFSKTFGAIDSISREVKIGVNKESLNQFSKAWEIIKSKQVKFVFNIHCVSDTWFFIENNNIYAIVLTNLTILDGNAIIKAIVTSGSICR